MIMRPVKGFVGGMFGQLRSGFVTQDDFQFVKVIIDYHNH